MAMDEKFFYRQVGNSLQGRRRALKLTQAQLAQTSSVRRTSIANIEAGRQAVPLHVLYQLAAALETDVGSLVPPPDKARTSNLVTVEVDGRLMNVPQRAADFVRRMREDGDSVDPS